MTYSDPVSVLQGVTTVMTLPKLSLQNVYDEVETVCMSFRYWLFNIVTLQKIRTNN